MSHERKNCEMVKPSQREALLISLRQCLFEQRVIGLFLGPLGTLGRWFPVTRSAFITREARGRQWFGTARNR